MESWKKPVKWHFERKDIKIYPIGDVHYGALGHQAREWSAFCDKLQRENAYIIICGDMINNGLANSVDPYGDVLQPITQKDNMATMLRQIKDRILFVCGGNHEYRSRKASDDSVLYDICCRIGIEDRYREEGGVLLFKFGEQHHAQQNPMYSFFITHGTGGGVYTGGAVNRFENFANCLDGVDGLIAGHVHKTFVTSPSKIYVNPQSGKVSIRPFVVQTCVSWLDYVGYAVQKMLRPATTAKHATTYMTLCGTKKQIALSQIIIGQ